jgi:integrase
VCAIVQKLLTLRQAAALVDGVAPSARRRQAAWTRITALRGKSHSDGATVPTRAHERLLDRGDRPLEPPAIYQVWPRLLTRARLSGRPGGRLSERTPHALRHTFASLHIAKAIEAGRDRDAILTYLRSQLRHRSIQTTMDYYIHLFPGGQREITNRLDDDSGQDWTPVFRPTRTGPARDVEPSPTVAKPSHLAKTSQARARRT